MFELHPQLKQDTVIVGQFNLSLVLLHKDANYPWCILVPKRSNMNEIHHLSEVDQIQLIKESSHLSEVMTSIFAPDTMNIAELGNLVPQLHLHHVARYKTDACWPAAVWGAKPPAVYTEGVMEERLQRLQSSLVGEGFEAAGAMSPDSNVNPGYTP
ncbi:HIT domain-containing protein [Saccharophagus degradans]|uniref:Histidine triad (HIT) protein n=1 Tax=Saccharophagus degradans (strain 2-40 / ATCC 43961 / DSM 17024) TaxID=203122 RepID=Q21MA7_SACD2|nr:HIT family protein [Saccharophagus degradans]ABD80172.1 histidine triad (HIT) protein [Saccharophagus degradans 2-40]